MSLGLRLDRIQRIFNCCWGRVQNLTPGLACQEFVPELGSASQCHGTKVDHEMSSKYWSNSWPRGKNLRNEISNCSPPMWAGEPSGFRKEKNTCDPTGIRLQPLHMVSPQGAQDVKKHRIAAQDSWDAYERNDFTEPRLLHLPIHRKAQNSLTWYVWFSIIYNNLLMFRLSALCCKTSI